VHALLLNIQLTCADLTTYNPITNVAQFEEIDVIDQIGLWIQTSVIIVN